MFSGAMVALITPFDSGEVDFNTLDELVRVSSKKRHRRHSPLRHNRRIADIEPSGDTDRLLSGW